MAQRTKAFPAETEGVGAPGAGADGAGRRHQAVRADADDVDWEVEPGKFVEAWAYNGMVPGPTISVDVGDKVRIVLHNELPRVDRHPLPRHHRSRTRWTACPTSPRRRSSRARRSPTSSSPRSPPSACTTRTTTPQQVPNGLARRVHRRRHAAAGGRHGDARSMPMVLNDAGAIGLTLNGKSFPATAPISLKQGDWVQIALLQRGPEGPPDAPARHAAAGDRQGRLSRWPRRTWPTPSSSRRASATRCSCTPTEPGRRGPTTATSSPTPSATTGMFGMVTALIVE